MTQWSPRIRESLKHYVPFTARLYEAIVNLRTSARRVLKHRRWRHLTAREVFSEVYAKGIWGGPAGSLCSGGGSDEEFAEPYCRHIQQFVAARGDAGVTIVDLGCGDFRVGERLIRYVPESRYIGVDIVPGLIERNRTDYSTDRVSFVCRDIIDDELPQGDICLLRQVLQHLSNAEIASILRKLAVYRHVFITEQYPVSDLGVIPNRDKPHGPDVRLDRNSGVYLDKPPFALPRVREVLRIPYRGWGELRTFYIEPQA
jgi:SAM-dependent methyltransferase